MKRLIGTIPRGKLAGQEVHSDLLDFEAADLLRGSPYDSFAASLVRSFDRYRDRLSLGKLVWLHKLAMEKAPSKAPQEQEPASISSDPHAQDEADHEAEQLAADASVAYHDDPSRPEYCPPDERCPCEGPWEAADALFQAQTTLKAVKAPKTHDPALQARLQEQADYHANKGGDVLDAFLAGF